MSFQSGKMPTQVSFIHIPHNRLSQADCQELALTWEFPGPHL